MQKEKPKGKHRLCAIILKKAKDKIYAINKEGYRTGDWILLGFDDIVIHIFKPEARQFYNLEHVWQDAIHVDINDLIVK